MSKPKTTVHGHSDEPQPTKFVAKMNPSVKPGDWRGKFVPVAPKRTTPTKK